MIDCISVENMRLSDRYTIDNLIPSLELMHRAALGVFHSAVWHTPVAIVSGSGNNGGDGYALACILKNHGYSCTVFSVGSHLSEDSSFYADEAEKLGVPILPFHAGCLTGYETVVDCLLGTGFSGPVRENYRLAIEEINSSDAFVISVDINSGMNGDTGEADLAVCSDLTVTIGYVKTGLVSEKAGRYMKKLVCVDIGIVLVREELKICSENEPSYPNSILCPRWLDMNILSVK